MEMLDVQIQALVLFEVLAADVATERRCWRRRRRYDETFANVEIVLLVGSEFLQTFLTLATNIVVSDSG